MPRSTCPIGCALDLLGDRWTLLVARDLLLAGKRRFSELCQPEGIATNILADRLKRLEAAGAIRKTRDPDDGRSFLYSPTPAGADLIPILLDLGVWGASHLAGGTAHPELIAAAQADREGLLATLRAAALAEDPASPGAQST